MSLKRADHRTARPSLDPHVGHLLERTRDVLGDMVATVTVCEQDGVRHTWGSCPFGGDDELGLVLSPNTSVYQIPVWQLPQATNCTACAGQLRVGGGMSRWLATQLTPVPAALDAQDPGSALAACVPTRLVTQAGVAALLAHITARFSLACRLAGPVTLAHRAHTGAARLPAGAHHPSGLSVVHALPGEAVLGESWDAKDSRLTAGTFFLLRERMNAECAATPKAASPVATEEDRRLWDTARFANLRPNRAG